LNQGACIDAFGVGERLITSESEPIFGGVYKLAAIEDERGRITPKIKISENTSKITNPDFKTVYRLFDRKTGKALADQICLYNEEIDDNKPLEIFDPDYTWKRKTLSDFKAVKLMKQIFKDGELVYEMPTIKQIREYCARQMETLWDEVTRFENPHDYYVDLSEKLWNIKKDLLDNHGKQGGNK
jgi:nicotinate phosphoribosyltransferase